MAINTTIAREQSQGVDINPSNEIIWDKKPKKKKPKVYDGPDSFIYPLSTYETIIYEKLRNMILLMTLQDGPVIGIEDNERYVINNNKDIISDKRPTSPEVLSHQKSFQHLRKGDNIYYYGRGYGGVYIL